MDVGVLGGTFDPIHLGHLAIAEEVRARLDLAEIIFIPTGLPWLRASSPIAAAEYRVQMVRLAIANKPYFKLSTLEIERAGPSYSVDTIAELQEQLGDKDKLFFILGYDSLATLPQWREPAQLIKMCRLVAVPRPGYSAPDLKKLEAVIPGLSQRMILLEKPEVDISAREIRNRVAQGLSVRRFVPEPVGRYIKQHRLYNAISGIS